MKKKVVTAILSSMLVASMLSGCGSKTEGENVAEREITTEAESSAESTEASEETSAEVSETGTDIILSEKASFIVEAAKAVYECDGLDSLKAKMDEIAPDSLYAMQDEYYMWASEDLDLDEGTYTWYVAYDPDEGVGFAYLDTEQDVDTMSAVTDTLTESGYPVDTIGSINDSSLLGDLGDDDLARKIFTTTEDDGVYGYYAANLMMTVSEYCEAYGYEGDEEYAASDEVVALMPDGWEAYYQDDDVIAAQSSGGIDVEFWTASCEWSSVSVMMEAYGCEDYELVGTYSCSEVWREKHTYDDSSWYTYYSIVDGHEFDFSDYDIDTTDAEIEDALSVAQILAAYCTE